MKPFRDHVALAIDGGGIKGIMVARALMQVEKELGGKPLHEWVGLAAGTSTGAVIAAAIAREKDAETIFQLYKDFAKEVFRPTFKSRLPGLLKYVWRYRYSGKRFMELLEEYLTNITIGQLHKDKGDKFHMVMTATDITINTTRFIKLYEKHFAQWRLADVVMASSVIPTVFPVFEHDYWPRDGGAPEKRYWVDGGVGSYANPCYLAAFEIDHCLRNVGWLLNNTTLISIGTGRNPQLSTGKTPDKWIVTDWLLPIIDDFVHQANEQQVRLVNETYEPLGLDFRRFNIDFDEAIGSEDIHQIEALTEWGDKLGEKIVTDKWENIEGYRCGDPGTDYEYKPSIALERNIPQ